MNEKQRQELLNLQFNRLNKADPQLREAKKLQELAFFQQFIELKESQHEEEYGSPYLCDRDWWIDDDPDRPKFTPRSLAWFLYGQGWRVERGSKYIGSPQLGLLDYFSIDFFNYFKRHYVLMNYIERRSPGKGWKNI